MKPHHALHQLGSPPFLPTFVPSQYLHYLSTYDKAKKKYQTQ